MAKSSVVVVILFLSDLLFSFCENVFLVGIKIVGKKKLCFVLKILVSFVLLVMILPKIDGLTVLTKLRSDGKDCHVLILSANDQTEDRVRGLDLGADDYLVKPFAFDELVSRLRALNRRRSGVKKPVIEIDGIKVDSVARQVLFDDKQISLTPHEYQLLEFLARRRGRVFSHDQLIDQLYDAGSYVTRNAVEAHVSALRKRLNSAGAPKLVQTRRGFGYLVE